MSDATRNDMNNRNDWHNWLIDWQGRVDDTEISFDAGMPDSQRKLLEGDSNNQPDSALLALPPAFDYTPSDNLRDILDASWESPAKTADRTDYLIAVACGTIAGIIDIFYVGTFSLENANEWGETQINKFVIQVAKIEGYKGDGLRGAIAFLEKLHPFAADGVTAEFGGGLQHHLRDFSHHFSLGGLMFSLFNQFTGLVIGTDVHGDLHTEKITDGTFIGSNLEEKLFWGTVNWFFHMVSDMAGSSSTPGKGTGIPGPLLSLIKEMSALPVFKDHKVGETDFRTWISKLFNGTLCAKRDSNGRITEPVRFDLRTEIGILHGVACLIVPVLINECLVRGSYFIRRLFLAIRDNNVHSLSDLEKINAAELLPTNNRAIARMVTVATGTFTVIDMTDAAVKAIAESRGVNVQTVLNFVVRINFVGIGRFIIAVRSDWNFITDDIRTAQKQRVKKEEEYEKRIANLDVLSLNYYRTQILYSLELLNIDNDIMATKMRMSAQKATVARPLEEAVVHISACSQG